MWERLFGIQIGGVWAFVQFLELTALLLVILWILSKIELPDRVGAPIQQEEEKE